MNLKTVFCHRRRTGGLSEKAQPWLQKESSHLSIKCPMCSTFNMESACPAACPDTEPSSESFPPLHSVILRRGGYLTAFLPAAQAFRAHNCCLRIQEIKDK